MIDLVATVEADNESLALMGVEVTGSDRAAGPPAKFLFSTRREGDVEFSPDGN